MSENGQPNGLLAERQISSRRSCCACKACSTGTGRASTKSHGPRAPDRRERGRDRGRQEIDQQRNPLAGNRRRRHRLRAAAQRRDILERAELFELAPMAFAGLVAAWVTFEWGERAARMKIAFLTAACALLAGCSVVPTTWPAETIPSPRERTESGLRPKARSCPALDATIPAEAAKITPIIGHRADLDALTAALIASEARKNAKLRDAFRA
jgi:hypothetical protein